MFDESVHALLEHGVDAANLDDALTALEKLDPIQARIVELRFFGGLSVEETAGHMKMSTRSVIRQWGLAKAWLANQLGGVAT